MFVVQEVPCRLSDAVSVFQSWIVSITYLVQVFGGRGIMRAAVWDTAEKGVETVSESDFELVEGSGNVFRDLGDPDADLKQAKAILAARIVAVLDGRGLSVRKAAALTGFAAADFSRTRNADLGRFTLDRLMKMLAALDDRLRVTLRVDTALAASA